MHIRNIDISGGEQSSYQSGCFPSVYIYNFTQFLKVLAASFGRIEPFLYLFLRLSFSVPVSKIFRSRVDESNRAGGIMTTINKGLSANTLKIIAVIAMTIDHTALVFVNVESPLYIIMRLIGRLACPIFCFFIAEGFRHTRNRREYIKRMAVFALISQVPFYLMVHGFPQNGVDFLFRQSVMFTFVVSLLVLSMTESKRSLWAKVVIITLYLCLSMFGDWGIFAPVWCLIFYVFRGRFKVLALLFTLFSVIFISFNYFSVGLKLTDFAFQYGVLLSLFPIYFYNGERGGKSTTFNKWFFYGFYPIHMAVLVIAAFLLR
jgi:hypothetical protein